MIVSEIGWQHSGDVKSHQKLPLIAFPLLLMTLIPVTFRLNHGGCRVHHLGAQLQKDDVNTRRWKVFDDVLDRSSGIRNSNKLSEQ